MLSAELALVELEVVQVGVVRLDALEKQVAGLLQEGVDGEVESIERGVQGRPDLVVLDIGQGAGGLNILLGRRSGNLVEERGKEVGVADNDGELGKDITESKLGLL